MKAFSVPLKATEGLALGRLSTPFSVMAQAGHWDTCLRAILGWTVKATIALINYCFHKEYLVYYPLGDTSLMVFYLFFFFWGVGETAQTNKHPLFHHLVSERCESIPCNTLLLCSARELACSHDTIFKVIQSSTHLPQCFTQTAATFQGVCIFSGSVLRASGWEQEYHFLWYSHKICPHHSSSNLRTANGWWPLNQPAAATPESAAYWYLERYSTGKAATTSILQTLLL